jgi:UDP-GlcNAc3NAcA epimerase
MKILTIVGARPQFVKAAVISREIRNFPNIDEVIVHTGQHFDKNMSDIFFEEMDIPKTDYNLEINSLSHGAMTGRMLEDIEKVVLEEKPDWVLVYGDTNSTLAGALAATKLHIKVAHVEAGLRSFNMKMPEEVNRILTDRISDFLFCPSDVAMSNLISEGFGSLNNSIVKVGDVMQDAAIYYTDKGKSIDIELPEDFILATVHRAENTNNEGKLSSIIEAFNQLNKNISVVLPLHPRTRNYIKKYDIVPEFIIIDPVGYLEMINLIQKATLIMTDSGGLQKEAFFFEKPCITLRDETEWVELIESGVNTLCDTRTVDAILDKYNIMVNKKLEFDKNLYGGGNAANKIIKCLLDYK